jgi:hypothetical protein
MAVLLEGFGVVVRNATLGEKYPGGQAAYAADCPNATLCSDGVLTRVGFMHPDDVEKFVTRLAGLGFVVRGRDGFAEVAVATPATGPGNRLCDWLEVGPGPDGVRIAWLAGTEPGEMALPEGRTAARPLGFVTTEEARRFLTHVRTEGGVDVFVDSRDGKEYYVGRTRSKEPTAEELYRRGAGLLKPYFHLVDRPSRDPSTPEGRREVDEGIALLRTVIRMRPQLFNPHWVLGKAYEALGDQEQAYSFFRRAFELAPEQVDVIREYVRACLELGKAEEAVPAARQACELRGEDVGLQANYGLALLIAGRVEEARATVQAALDREPQDEITRHLLAWVEDVRSGKKPRPTRLPR